jgi:hypothetical protein
MPTSQAAILSWSDQYILIATCGEMLVDFMTTIVNYVHGAMNVSGFKGARENYFRPQ